MEGKIFALYNPSLFDWRTGHDWKEYLEAIKFTQLGLSCDFTWIKS